MRKFPVLGAIVIAAMFALSAPQPAGAFISNQNGIATVAHATTNTIRSAPCKKEPRRVGITARKRAGTAHQGRPAKGDR